MTEPNGPGQRYEKTLIQFVLRARRIEAHSLASDRAQLLRLAQGEIKIEVRPAEQKTFITRKLPPEEQLESAAARVRPMILQGDPTYHGTVLAAIGYFVRADDRLKAAHRKIRDGWRVAASPTGRLGMYTQVSKDGEESEMLSDKELGLAYIYGDVVHHDPEHLERTRLFGVQNRFEAASLLVPHLIVLTLSTLGLVRTAIEAGLIELPNSIFTEPVVPTETAWRREAAAWVGTEPPLTMHTPPSQDWERMTGVFEG